MIGLSEKYTLSEDSKLEVFNHFNMNNKKLFIINIFIICTRCIVVTLRAVIGAKTG